MRESCKTWKRYLITVVEDEGNRVDPVFIHDPDGYMVELYNSWNLPILPPPSRPFKLRLSRFNKAIVLHAAIVLQSCKTWKRYLITVVEDEGNRVDPVFIHDPDGYMVELYNSWNLPILPPPSRPFKLRLSRFNKAIVLHAAIVLQVFYDLVP
ncbi:hypothetical protein GOBAR_AA05720 [Gossypium barbadense]|uniref:VOC domain-containing protein n=1 Tax=Gossypium barbadense TaxID=3634 RepID=A0A2P5YH21_GOSBA|nr:hypothetical protein GOBAR_AA05720 [Gossypium barbadense]